MKEEGREEGYVEKGMAMATVPYTTVEMKIPPPVSSPMPMSTLAADPVRTSIRK